MIKSFIVDSTFNEMRFDRFLRNKIGKIPQSLIEKNLRAGKIKLNKKKIKSSHKIKTNDKIDFFNINFKEKILILDSLNLHLENEEGYIYRYKKFIPNNYLDE